MIVAKMVSSDCICELITHKSIDEKKDCLCKDIHDECKTKIVNIFVKLYLPDSDLYKKYDPSLGS